MPFWQKFVIATSTDSALEDLARELGEPLAPLLAYRDELRRLEEGDGSPPPPPPPPKSDPEPEPDEPKF